MAKYWVGGAGNWDNTSTTHWSDTDGGTGGATVPSTTDDVYFTSESNNPSGADYIINCSGNAINCANLSLANPSAGVCTLRFTSSPNVYGNVDLAANTLISGYGGGVVFKATSGVKTITTNGVVFVGNHTINGSGGTFRVVGDLVLNSSSLTMTAGTFDATTNSVTVTNNYPNTTLNGNWTFYNLTLSPSAPAKTDSLTLGGNLTVTNLLTIDEGATLTNRRFIKPNLANTVRTITAHEISINNSDFYNITGVGDASWDLSEMTGGSGNCGGNTMQSLGDAAFTTPETQTATGTTSFTWSTHGWTSRVPLPQDDVVINNSFSAGRTITIDMPILGKNVDFSGMTGSPTLSNSSSLYVCGSLTMGTTTAVWGGAGQVLLFIGKGNYTFTPGSSMYNGSIYVDAGTNNSLTLKGNLIFYSARSLLVNSGTLSCVDGNNNWSITGGTIGIPFGSVGTLTFGSATHTFEGNFSITTGSTVTSSTGTLKFIGETTTAYTFAGAGKTYNNIWFDRGTSTADISITSSNTFNDFKDTGTAAHTIHFANSSTQTISTMTVNGSSGNLITLSNASSTTRATLTKANGGVIRGCDYIAAVYLAGSPADTWYIGANSTDTGSTCTNIILTAAPGGVTNTTNFFMFM